MSDSTHDDDDSTEDDDVFGRKRARMERPSEPTARKEPRSGAPARDVEAMRAMRSRRSLLEDDDGDGAADAT